ncbi:MAG: hypothetical protein HYV09_02740 [Deltaproteobacteria bacterium]|nr:hypothetical protein [Deltaproteobacteria bacterium]
MIAHRFGSLLVASLLLCTRAASADDEKEACVLAHADAQRAMKAVDLVMAHRALTRCSRTSCPAPVRLECIDWLADVSARVPSVIFVARVGDAAVTEVLVRVDGELVAATLDGRSYALNPGEHVVRFERAGAEAIERRVLVLESDRSRVVEGAWPAPSAAAAPVAAQVASPKPAPPDAPRAPVRPTPIAAWVLAGVGVVGLATFIGFAVDGRVRQAELEAGCAPYCAADEVRAMRRSYLIGDVALAVSLASFAGSGALFWVSSGPATSPTVTVAWRF